MILFHLNYSLVYVFWIEALNFSEPFWYILWKIAALWFMTISGVSFFLASQKYSQRELRAKYLRYATILWAVAIGISWFTYAFIPEQIILFGILHFFALSFLLLPYITGTTVWSIISFFTILGFFYFISNPVETHYLFWLWFYHKDFYSADYYPLIPYLLYILLWYFWARMLHKYRLLHIFRINRELIFIEKLLSYMWKKSLLIYLAHQPILITLIWLALKIW